MLLGGDDEWIHTVGRHDPLENPSPPGPGISGIVSRVRPGSSHRRNVPGLPLRVGAPLPARAAASSDQQRRAPHKRVSQSGAPHV